MSYLKIEGKLVQLVEERVTRQCELNDWLAALAAAEAQTTPLLPQGCRMYSRSGAGLGVECYVIEQSPARRTLTWHSEKPWGDAAKPDQRWRLAFPYVVFVVQPQPLKLFAYYRTAPLSATSDSLACANLGNIYTSNNNVCLADTTRITALTNPVERVNALITSFWASEFNADLMDLFLRTARFDKRVETLSKWEAASEANPLFTLEVPWIDAKVTLADVIKGG